jgi:hypothetical protein
MQRAWITGLTLAGVLGTGGAAFAGMSVGHSDGSAVEAQAPGTTSATTSATATDTTTTYRLGDAGTVTISVAGGVITVAGVEPATGWTQVGSSAAGVHVDVTLTDGTQLLHFAADLVDGRAVASLTNAPTGTVAPPTNTPIVPAPRAATPVIVLTTVPAKPVTTTAASGSAPSSPSSTRTAETTRTAEKEGGSDD